MNRVVLRTIVGGLVNFIPESTKVSLLGYVSDNLLNGHAYYGSQSVGSTLTEIDTGVSPVGYGGIYIIKLEGFSPDPLSIAPDGVNAVMALEDNQICMFRSPLTNAHPKIRTELVDSVVSFIIIGAH